MGTGALCPVSRGGVFLKRCTTEGAAPVLMEEDLRTGGGGLGLFMEARLIIWEADTGIPTIQAERITYTVTGCVVGICRVTIEHAYTNFSLS